MCWFRTVIFLCFALLLSNKLSEANRHPHKLPTAAAVVGTVYCDTCLSQSLTQPNHFIAAGATVEVECKSSGSRPHFRQQVKTNSGGEFRVELPFSVVNQIRAGCSVALIRSPDPFCAAGAPQLRFKLRKGGRERVFSAGLFTFKPQVCDQKQFFPPNPLNPGLLPPNPLLPPPSLLPPVLPTPPPSLLPPVFPSPPPSLFPPILPTPPSSSPPLFPGLPPFPGLIPSPPPPPPTLPIPLPPVPILPPLIPGIPGGPPKMRKYNP